MSKLKLNLINCYYQSNKHLVLTFLISFFVFAISGETSALKNLNEEIHDPKYVWMDKQIKRDLVAFEEEGISLEMLEKTLQNILASPEKGYAYLIHYKIINNKITFWSPTLRENHPRIINFINFITEIAKHMKLPDVEFLLCAGDSFERPIFLESCQVPIFCIAKRTHNNKVLLFPETEYLSNRVHLFSAILHANSIHTWENKISKAFWRGSTTGGPYCFYWDRFPRPSLIVSSYYHPEDVDAAFIKGSFYVDEEPAKTQILRFKSLEDPVPISHQIQYKYLIAVDGNSWPSSLPWQLLSNSVVLKNDSDYIDWYYEALSPYEHYVPYKNCEDLLVKINWLRKNDLLAGKISKQATSLAANLFKRETIAVYLYKLLLTYSKLQNFQPQDFENRRDYPDN